jgi:hypothetical protein
LIASRRVVLDPHLVIHLAVQLRIEVRLQDRLEHAELAYFLALEAVGLVEHFAVAVPQNIGREPAP